MKKFLIICLAAVAMTGCKTGKGVLSSYKKENVVSVQDINTDSIFGDGLTAEALRGDSAGLGGLKWRELFTDPVLQALIERVLAQNTDMVNADFQLQEVEHALKAAKLAFAPSVSLNLNGASTRPWDPYNRYTFNNTLSYGIAMTLGWQNVNFLALRNAKKGAEISKQQMQYAKQAIQAQLVANTATMYYTLAQLDEQIVLMNQTRDNWAEYLRMEKLLMDAGQSNIAVVSSIEATYWNICQSLVTLKDNVKILENGLTTLMSERPQKITRTALDSFHAPEVIATGLPVNVLRRRPDVNMDEMKLAKAFYDVNQARSAFFPSLTLTATGEFTNNSGAGIVNPGIMIGQAVAALAQPIFANGQLRARLRISKEEFNIAKNNFVSSMINAGNEVNTAMVKVRSAEEMRELINNQVKALETSYDANRKLYANSSANYLNVITAHNNLLSARMEQIANRMESISATVELYQALGGGAD